MKPLAAVAAEFDAIAAAMASSTAREVLTPAHRTLLEHLPANAARALDVGCGDGLLTRAIAQRGIRVLGIDLSPRMIALARARTDPAARAEYRVADVMTGDIPEKPFDVVLSVNTVHHVALGDIVPRLASLVAPGGTLLIQDVVARNGLRNFALNVIAAVHARFRRLVTRSRMPREVTALYDAHGKNEKYLEPAQVAPTYVALLPGSQVIHHLEWRYSVVWRRPAETSGFRSGH
jgi:SAM-dependent methyltransferase